MFVVLFKPTNYFVETIIFVEYLSIIIAFFHIDLLVKKKKNRKKKKIQKKKKTIK